MKDSIATPRFEVNELVAMVKVIMIGLGKSPQEGGTSERKGKEKVLKPRLDAGEKNAQKIEEFVGNKEQEFMALYIEDAAFVARRKLNGLKQTKSLRDYMKELLQLCKILGR